MTDTSKAYFDAVGGDWDRLREGFFSERVRERALELARVEPGQIAADLGAGTGFVTEALIERGLKVIAVDHSPPMLEALRRKFPDREAVDCRTGKAEQLPIDDAAIDYSFANMFLHHVEDPALAIREMARVVRPGGRVVITDLDTHDHEFLRSEHHDRWMGFARDDIHRWFRESGLTEVWVGDLDESCCASSCNGETAAASIFIAAGIREGPPSEDAAPPSAST
jgi:ubiquinone/menaquinone biosynthesis C-methylase UbiE